MLSPIPKISRYRRIVAIGPRHSGKSVLLASILDHLRKDPGNFLASGDRWIRHGVERYPGDLPPIPLDRILREAAEEALWPEITVSPSALRFRATHERPWKRDLVLDFIDFPGEAVADFLGGGSYDDWSEAVFAHFPDDLDPESVEGLRAYRAALSKAEDDTGTEALAARFADLMVEATRRGRYLTTPSVLCSRVFEDTPSGPKADFAPVPLDLASRLPRTRAEFARRFADYRRDQVLPLESLLADADALVLPIDVGWILSGGPSVLRDQHALLSAVGALLERIDSVWNRLGSFLGRSLTPLDDSLFPGRLRSVVLCATKIDLFRPADRSLLDDLIRRLAEPVLRGAGAHGLRVLNTACAAVRSSTDAPGADGRIRGYRGGEALDVLPPALPEQWPDRWNPADFRFPRLDPRVSRNGLYPPAHIHLDRIVRSIIEA